MNGRMEHKTKNEAEAMAHIVCEMASKPTSCGSCPGRKGGCFTIPKMHKLIENGYGKVLERSKQNDKF